MRWRVKGLVVVPGFLALVALAVVLGLGTAVAHGQRKLVEGTLYDTTCTSVCAPECPPIPCGPVPQAGRQDIVCAQTPRRRIACPMNRSVRKYPVYSGEGAVVRVRRRGSATVIATLPMVEGHFKARLGPGEYILRPYLPEEPCWSGEPRILPVTGRMKSPVPAPIDVSNNCVAHPDAP